MTVRFLMMPIFPDSFQPGSPLKPLVENNQSQHSFDSYPFSVGAQQSTRSSSHPKPESPQSRTWFSQSFSI